MKSPKYLAVSPSAVSTSRTNTFRSTTPKPPQKKKTNSTASLPTRLVFSSLSQSLFHELVTKTPQFLVTKVSLPLASTNFLTSDNRNNLFSNTHYIIPYILERAILVPFQHGGSRSALISCYLTSFSISVHPTIPLFVFVFTTYLILNFFIHQLRSKLR